MYITLRYITLLLCFHNCVCLGQKGKFLVPLKGEAGRDFFIDSYFDHDTMSSIRDVFCGKRTYDGHSGTDFCISGFKAMDKGVDVLAAANGRVVDIVDGNFDRSKQRNKHGRGNYVAILHEGGMITYYLHLKTKSICCSVGDSVVAAQKIAQVGSSGDSWNPHLHFEVKDMKRKSLDPFSGSCADDTSHYWISQPKLNTNLTIIESGFVPYIPQLDSLQEGHNVTDTFELKHDSLVCFWAYLNGLNFHDKLQTKWMKRRVTYTTNTYLWRNARCHEYYWSWIKMPSTKGVWHVEFSVNDVLLSTKKFYLK